MQERSVVIFTGKYSSPSTAEHIEAVANEFPHWRITIVQESPPFKWGSYLRTKVRMLKRQPISYSVEVLTKLLRLPLELVRRIFRRSQVGSTSVPTSVRSLDRLDLPNVSYRREVSFRDPAIVDRIKELKPWLGISVGAPILSANLFQIPELGTLNLHKSFLPNYRGQPPGFWEIHDSAEQTGASVHWVVEALDAGAIVSQRELKVPRYATPAGLKVELDIVGTAVLLDALHQVESGNAEGTVQKPPPGRPNRQPTWLVEQRVIRDRSKKRKPQYPPHIWLRTAIKHFLMFFFVYLWAPVRNRVLSLSGRCHTVVLLYHRVDDAFLDTVTVGVEQFSRQLSIITRGYEVLDLKTFLEKRGQPAKRPRVVITFDDGYYSKYVAAVLLRRHGLPATFFLSTGMIGTDKPFPHDMLRLGYRVPSLNWDEVARMARWGFTFGIHTVNHARLGEVPLEEGINEVVQAKADLESHLGKTDGSHCLAYPYGQKSDMSDKLRELLPSLGVNWCFSAYGGVNPPDWKQLNILRRNLESTNTDLDFRAFLEGWAAAK